MAMNAPNNLLVSVIERLIRIETRLTKLMIHLGLDPQGHPAPTSSVPTSPTTESKEPRQ